MKLTALETEVLEDLRTFDGEIVNMSEDKLWRWVYIDNVIDTTDKSVRGVLGSLEKKGLYMSSDEDEEIAWVRVGTRKD